MARVMEWGNAKHAVSGFAESAELSKVATLRNTRMVITGNHIQEVNQERPYILGAGTGQTNRGKKMSEEIIDEGRRIYYNQGSIYWRKENE